MAGDDDQVVIERVIGAPRALVFRLWSRTEYLVRWFAPHRCTLEVHAFDFRADGELRTTIRMPDGGSCDAVTTFVAIVPEQEIVYRIRAHHPDPPLPEGWPEESTVTVTFADHDGGTLLTLRQTVPLALAKRTGAHPSWLEMLDRLDAEARRALPAPPPSLELFCHPLATYCHKVLIGLYESETPFSPTLVDLGDPASRTSFFAVAPLGKMPVLRDHAADRVIPESSIILEYLDERYAGARPLLPTDATLRLEARLWDRFFDQYVQTPMQAIVLDRLRPESERHPRGVADARAALRAAYGVLDGRMAGRTWAVGDDFGFVECAAAPALFYAGIVEPFEKTHPAVSAYFERLVARPSVARVLAEAKPYLAFFPYREAVPARFLGG